MGLDLKDNKNVSKILDLVVDTGVVTSAGYLLSYAYKVGYYDYMGIPKGMIRLGINDVITVVNINIVMVIFIKFLITVLRESKEKVIGIPKILIYLVNKIKESREWQQYKILLKFSVVMLLVFTVPYLGAKRADNDSLRRICEVEGVEYAVIDITDGKILVGEIEPEYNTSEEYISRYRLMDLDEKVIITRNSRLIKVSGGNSRELSNTELIYINISVQLMIITFMIFLLIITEVLIIVYGIIGKEKERSYAKIIGDNQMYLDENKIILKIVCGKEEITGEKRETLFRLIEQEF